MTWGNVHTMCVCVSKWVSECVSTVSKHRMGHVQFACPIRLWRDVDLQCGRDGCWSGQTRHVVHRGSPRVLAVTSARAVPARAPSSFRPRWCVTARCHMNVSFYIPWTSLYSHTYNTWNTTGNNLLASLSHQVSFLYCLVLLFIIDYTLY